MQVDLVSYTPNPMRVLWVAAKTCRSPKAPQELWREYGNTSRKSRINTLKNIWESGHQSVFEHVSMTYAVSYVSRVCLAQYSRHRIGVSLSVQSQRHVHACPSIDASLRYVIPPSIEDKNYNVIRQYDAVAKDAQATYNNLLAIGIPKEDARFVLPQGTATNFITTVNLRSLGHLYDLRVKKPGAQWEIKKLVTWMVRLILEKEPELEEIIGVLPENQHEEERTNAKKDMP